MSDEDGGNYISTYINENGMVVKDASAMSALFNLNEYGVLIIGDSFVQADEIKYEERIGNQIEEKTGVRVLSHGYSSWAPAIQTNWLLTKKIKKGAKVIYFVMPNDFIPNYSYNNIGYHKAAIGKQKINGQTVLEFSSTRTDLPYTKPKFNQIEILEMRSFFYSRILLFLKSMHQSLSIEEMKIQRSLYNKFKDCSAFNQAVKDDDFKKLGIYDYLTFRQKVECWSDSHRNQVASGISDIYKAKQYLDTIGVKLHVYLIPAPWSFSGETIIGKSIAGLRYDDLLSHEGLGMFMQSELQKLSITFTDLEPVIFKLKMKNDGQWYFPMDGHFTAYAHKVLAKYMIRDLGISK